MGIEQALPYADDAVILISRMWNGRDEKGGRAMPYHKILGHHPGWANSRTEEAIESDFTAGMSWTPWVNKMASKFGRKGLISLALTGSLLFGGGVAKASVDETVAKSVRSNTDYVAAMVGTDKAYQKDVSNLLYDTAAHESGRFKHNRQIAKRHKKVTKVNSKGKKYTEVKHIFTESGIGRSKFSIEPETGHYLFHWAQDHEEAMKLLTKTSGLTEEQLALKTTTGFADLIQSNEKYATATAWTKYMSRNVTAPGTLEEEASVAAKNYFVGRKKGRAALQKKYIAQFIRDAKASNPVLLATKTIGHDAGTASIKAVKVVKQTLKRVITKR